MKLLRYGAPGAEKPGVLDAAGALRDLSDIVSDIDGASLTSDGLATLRADLERFWGQALSAYKTAVEQSTDEDR